MAGSIKGITIEFRGDTTKLDSALRKVNKSTKDIDKELRQVDKALKFNPRNVDLLRQKSELLGKKISETRDKLDLLKQTQAKVDAGEIEMSAEEYRKLQRDIIETESKLKSFEAQQKQVDNALKGMDMQKVSDQFKSYGESLTRAGEAMRGVSMAGAAVTAAIGALAYKAGTAADDLNTLSKVTGIGTEKLQMYSAASDLVDVSVETIAKSSKKLTKSMASAQDGTGTTAEAFDKLGISVTDANGNLRNNDDVFQETIAALGKMSNETERDALAQEIFGKSAAELNPLIEDQGETFKMVTDALKKYDLDFVDQETLDKANQFNDSLDTMKMLGSTALSIVGSQLAGYLAPALEKVVDWVGKLANWLSQLDPRILTIIAIVGAVVAAIAPVLLFLGKIAFAISSITGLMATMGVSFAAIAGPVAIVIAVIAALIAIGVLLYKNWDVIKAKAAELKAKLIQIWNNIKTSISNTVTALKNTISSIWNAIKAKVTSVATTIKSALSNAWNTIKSTASSMWNNIKTAILTPIQAAKDKVKSIIDTIKGYFPFHIGRIISGLKLPHFSLSGKFSLNPPSVPHLSVNWYAKGGIFDSPSLIGIGEKGPEAVVPLDKFWDKLDKMQGGNTSIVININGADKDGTEIAEEVRRVLINEVKRRRLAWQ